VPPAIADLAFLSDSHSAALVDREGAVVWWCPERFDARPCFAALLDPAAGRFRVGPSAPAAVLRAYREDTLVLETTFRTATGVLRVTDALALAPGERGHALGLGAPHALVRLAEVLAGEVELDVDLEPRLDFGLVRPELEATEEGLRTRGGPGVLALRTDAALHVARHRARGRETLREGDRRAFVLRHRPGFERDEPAGLPGAEALLQEATAGWRSWVAHHRTYDGLHAGRVRTSALVLQGLTHAPTGALVAAATTSLPEVPGGPANWDYRFAWLRDASLGVRALATAACTEECVRYLDWMARVGAGVPPGELPQVVFGVAGERDLSEHELGHLEGFGGARPVRVGNAAWTQLQLDVPGEILDAAWTLRDDLDGTFPEPLARFLGGLADATAARWRETDSGMWEGREGERHYLPSKVMAWVALDRAVRLAGRLGEHGARAAGWAAERDAVHAAVLRDGFHEGVGAFTGALGSDHLDAGVLLMPLFGFLPADDPRMAATIRTVERELGAEDGLPRRWTGGEDEAPFAMVSFWLVGCLARLGELDRAHALFERVAGHANDLGLLSECLDGAGGLLGNVPQAFSHVGLVNAAASLDAAERGTLGTGGVRAAR
jgi:GH15 family glucan-1,4-alpha-glucosidase